MMTVPWLFQDVRAGEKSGTAVFEQDSIEKKVYFGKGEILFAASNLDDDRLGEFLLQKGIITRDQFDASAAAAAKSKKQLGTVLFELGLLSPQDLVAQVKLQVKHIILSLFSWQDGRYRFEEGRLPPQEIIALHMSTGSLILEGIQGLDWQIIRKRLPPMKTVLRPASDQSRVFQKADLTADQKTVLEFIDGSRNMEQLCSLSGIGDFNTLKAVYLLLALKIAEAGECFTRDAACFAAKRTASPGAGTPKTGTRQMIQEAFAAIKHQDDFQVLGVNAVATTEDIKKAYFRMAKMYHPDQHLEPEMADMKEKLETLFSRVHDAYKALSDPNRDRSRKTDSDKPVTGEYEEQRAEEYVENYAEKTRSAALYFNSGVKEFKAGNFWGAAEAFSWATRLDPVKAPYFYYHGLSLSHIPRKSHEAEESFQRAIEIDPLKPEHYLELAALYLKSDLKRKALNALASGLRANPNSEKIIEALKKAGGEIPQQGDGKADSFIKHIFKGKE